MVYAPFTDNYGLMVGQTIGSHVMITDACPRSRSVILSFLSVRPLAVLLPQDIGLTQNHSWKAYPCRTGSTSKRRKSAGATGQIHCRVDPVRHNPLSHRLANLSDVYIIPKYMGQIQGLVCSRKDEGTHLGRVMGGHKM